MTVYEPDEKKLKEILSLTYGQFSHTRLAVKIFSEFLGSEIYLISDPTLADQVEGVAYTPDEITKLMHLLNRLKPHYKERLQKLHDAKKIFQGKIVNDESV